MNRGVYTLGLRALAPLIWLWMARRAKRAGGRWEIFSPERFGRADPATVLPDNPVWMHAVSLGETRAALPLLNALLARGLPVLLTHTTATGRAEGERLFKDAIARGQLRQVWLPYDFPGATRRFLAAHRPRCGLLMEREIWPNLLAAARQARVPMALVSARYSASSLRQARRMGSVMREALAGLDMVLAQTAEDAGRLAEAGAPAAVVTGNLKFDLVLPPAQVEAGRAWRAQLGRQVVAVASTREGEDAPFIEAIKRHASKPGAPLFLLIPRHPQRFDEAAGLLSAAKLTFSRRSTGALPAPDAAVLLGDTLGEMAFYYAASDVAIVAGSFAPLGGQNLIEACAAGVPVIIGRHTFNFKQAAEEATAVGAVMRVDSEGVAVDAAVALLADALKRRTMIGSGKQWFRSHAGATTRTMLALESLLQ